MKNGFFWAVIGLVCALGLAAGPAEAEVTVSVTLTGNVDELMPILAQLRDMGFTQATVIDTGADPIRLTVHSLLTSDKLQLDGSAPGLVEGPASAPKLALRQPKVKPAGRAGVLLVTVRVEDPDNEVDTVAAFLNGNEEASLDLFDNGTHGDKIVGDGTWSCAINPLQAHGLRNLVITAYTVDGDPVTVTSEWGKQEPLKTEIAVASRK